YDLRFAIYQLRLFHEPSPGIESLPWESGAEDARTPNADASSAALAGAKRLECVRFIGAFRRQHVPTHPLTPPRRGADCYSPPRRGTGDYLPPRRGADCYSPPRRGTGDYLPPRRGADCYSPPRRGTGDYLPPRRGAKCLRMQA